MNITYEHKPAMTFIGFSTALAYEKFGDGEVNLVIGMGLGASMAE